MNLSLFPLRLKKAREYRDFSQEYLASKLNVSRATIQNYERGKTIPKMNIIRDINNILGCGVSWLTGESPEMLLATIGFNEEDKLTAHLEQSNCLGDSCQINTNEYADVPLISAQASAGGGRFIESDSDDTVRYLTFKRKWLHSMGRPQDFKIMEVRGDSMEPVISDNDLVLFDISRTEIRSGKIYAVAFDGHIYLKRLIDEPGKLILRSENKQYSDITIDHMDKSQWDNIQILGRAIWWCHAEAV